MTTSTPSPDDLLLIGVIVAPFGIRGQVKLKAITDRPEYIARHVRTVLVGKARTPLTISKLFEHKPGLLVLSLQGVESREAADELRGAEVYIREAEAAPLGEGEYFLHQLYGLAVRTEAGEPIGKVREVVNTGASDLLVISRPGQPDALIPMVGDFIVGLDLPGGVITVRPIEGLL